jgi:CheY-like chemotaxis protein
MAVMVLYTQMSMRTPDLPPSVMTRLQTVEHQAKRAGDLIQQILDFSRRAVFERQPVDLLPLLQEQVKLLERTLPENIEISLRCRFESKVGQSDDYTVNADPTRIQQVIMNLAVNARDAMPAGGRLLIDLGRLVTVEKKDAPLPGMEKDHKAWVWVKVTDNGVGIPPDTLPHIFEPFFTTKSAGEGTGLGLAQVYGIVKQHGGYIDPTSELGVGTTMTIYLPALSVSKPDFLTQDPQAVIRGKEETILVVEDNPITRQVLIESLKHLNYQVLEAENGRVALEVIEQHGSEIGLVLSDLVMPEMGGKALVHALKQRDLSLPIVVLTGHPMGDTTRELEAAGVVGWLHKPIDLDVLARIVNRSLENH